MLRRDILVACEIRDTAGNLEKPNKRLRNDRDKFPWKINGTLSAVA
jgi:hypothetical protein